MADGFGLEFQELGSSAALLRSAGDGISSSAGRLRAEADAGSAAGDGPCAAAYEAMAWLWVDQLIVLAEKASHLSVSTDTSALNYLTSDQTSAARFGSEEN